MQIRNLSPLAGALAVSIALAACNRQASEQTAGQKVDATLEKTQDKVEDARQATSDALKATRTAISDSAITASVKARLAADAELKMLDIQVETSSGRTVLRGSAPNAQARDRAAQIARVVDGVTSVDNELEVRP
jgi:hyperosmotically inducible periplasmic protein